MNIIKEATIKIIKPSELKVGDFILWGHFRCKVVWINLRPIARDDDTFAEILQFPDDEHSKISIKRYLTFYKIISYKEKKVKPTS